jgi:hypothetical protein
MNNQKEQDSPKDSSVNFENNALDVYKSSEDIILSRVQDGRFEIKIKKYVTLKKAIRLLEILDQEEK